MNHIPSTYPGTRSPDGRRQDEAVERARPILDQIPGGVLLLDADGRVVYLNGIAELRLDMPRSEIIGNDLFRTVLPALESEGVGDRYRREMAAGRASLAWEPTRNGTDNGPRLSLGIRSFILGGDPWGVVLIEDRSALSVERHRRKQSERMAALGELATGVAHEINNPLATIRGFTQLLADDLLEPDQAQALEVITTECARIARTIHNLQAFAKRQSSSEAGPVDLTAIVEEVLTLKRYALDTAGIETEVDLEPDPSPVHAEADALQRVVLALLAHAEAALEDRERDRRLVVRTRESTEGVVLYVVDNGSGVSRERLATLLSSPDPDRESGSLGLDVAAAIVREQGGQIWVDSAEDRGTAVFVRMPRIGEPEMSRDAEPRNAEVIPERPLRVLVADDEPTLRMALSLFLGRRGHEVVEAADADEAWRLAQESSFDVTLTDIRMPGDGLALLDRLAEMPTLRGRTILMTGDATHPRVRDRISAGHPSLLKPFDMADVVRMVETLGRGRE
jgi:signal transduction histidine kinase